MYAAGLTDIGQVRSQNQDALFISMEPVGLLPNLFIVADGMGGHKAGDVASNEAVARFCMHIREAGIPDADGAVPSFAEVMQAAAEVVNFDLHVLAQGEPSYEGMGTTFTAGVVVDGRVDMIHVGDSRAYAVSPEQITQLTSDHTYTEELLRVGRITPEEARNHPKRHHLTRVFGFDAEVEMDSVTHPLAGVDTLLLCTDGLTNMLDDPTLMEIINREGYVEDRVKALIDEANKRGGTDNISAVLIDMR